MMKRIGALLLILAVSFGVGNVLNAGATGEPNFRSGNMPSNHVDPNWYYTGNVKDQDGNLRVEAAFASSNCGQFCPFYTWRVQEWEPSGGGGCGCFYDMSFTPDQEANGDHDHACYTYGIESNKVYRVRFAAVYGNPYASSVAGPWWVWAYNHNC